MKAMTIAAALSQLKKKDQQTLAAIRQQHPQIIDEGRYSPLKIKGKYKVKLLAGVVNYDKGEYLFTLPLDVPTGDWGKTRVILPEDAPSGWKYLDSDTINHADGQILLKDIKAGTLIKLQHPEKTRGAGVLMHITSLPAPYYIGDLGPSAFAFADFLAKGRQTYWQMLPVNPTEAESDNSPYSSTSSIAGNILLISPDLLMQDGLLNKGDLQSFEHANTDQRVDYGKALKAKVPLLRIAYDNFLKQKDATRKAAFDHYKKAEAYWLDDYALFVTLQEEHGRLWHNWPEDLKWRKKKALQAFTKTNAAGLEQVKWLQYIFAVQWGSLKQYCNAKHIKLFGDMPFYMNYNSADVWADPQIFNLDKDGNVAGMAGVPPDYFSADGQLWGMPTYKWDVLKANGYPWWVRRIKKNLEYFDVIRLDHFRAFGDYWEVPAGEKTAVNGSWKLGPGTDFFTTMEKALGHLPLIAEDLGDISELVYNLRDEFKLPGMKVLQFAFDEQMAYSTHIPHNHTENSFVYTGTHDNNTTAGWYSHIDKAERKRIKAYTDLKLKDKNAYKAFVKMAYASVAKVAIIPMQDVLGLGEEDRMNIPSSTDGNWGWRLDAGYARTGSARWLRELATMFNR